MYLIDVSLTLFSVSTCRVAILVSPTRVYDNVDRDEDDEIDIMELDFALKAVNYDLISDAEMNYVHSVSHDGLS